MINELFSIMESAKEKISDDSDVVWTGYNTARELRDEIDLYVNQIKSGNFNGLEELYKHFFPTCTFQEHSISNGWMDEYINLAERFDKIYYAFKNRH